MDRSISYLTFYIDDKEYALPAKDIQTIFDVSEIKTIDSEIHFMKGVALKETGVLPVVDLGEVLSVSDNLPSESSSVILASFNLSGKTFKIGLLVDMVTSVLSISKKLVADSVQNNTLSIPKEVEVVITDNCQKIYLLKPQSLFSEDDLLDLFIEINKFLGIKLA